MKLKHSIATAFTGLTTHKSRSLLTILGIVIGVTSIILIMSVGEGTEMLIVNEIGGLGAETIVIRPGKEPSGPTDFAELLFADSLRERELNALLAPGNVPDLVAASPEIIVPGSVAYEGETFKPLILGFSADFLIRTFNLVISEGLAFDDIDIKSRSRVTIIGSRVKEELFGDQDAIGKTIQIKGEKFRVVGIFEQRGQVVFFDLDELVLVPYTTAQTYLTGTKHYVQIILSVTSADVVDRAVVDIERTLRNLHGIENPENDDFYVQTQQAVVEQVKNILGALTIFLAAVVAIALVVGGIGVMNIMLVSVTERTKEIGLRKALGATEGNILTQFLLEAVMLTATGGIISIILSAGIALFLAFAITYFTGFPWEFAFPIPAAILGLTVSSVIGLIFGLYPAKQAAKKNPIDALRYE
jgi:putative ABC transport system permease protein